MRIWRKVVWQWIRGKLVELPDEGISYQYEGPLALAGGSSPTTKEVHFRLRSDTGTVDAVPTWIAAEDTSGTVTPGTAFRVRASVENTGTASDTITTLDQFVRCGYAADSFTNLTNIINGADASTSVDGTNVTVQRLTSGTGAFATGTAGYDENEVLSCAVANGNFTEVETGIVLTGGASTIGAGGGETWTAAYGGLTNAADHTITWTTADTNGSDFQHGAQLGGATQKVANSASISMTTAAAASSGNLVVVVVVCDNNGTADGDNAEISGVTIGGTAATKAREHTNGNGTAQTGITTSVWYLQLTGNLASGSTITATFTTAATSGDCNAIQAREFIVAANKTVSVEASNAIADDAVSQPSSLDATTSNIECLRVCARGCEDGDTNAAKQMDGIRASNNTWSLWWTAGALVRTTGTATTDVSNIVEATISTGTSAASRIGDYNAIATDWSSVYVAFKAVTADVYYPMPQAML